VKNNNIALAQKAERNEDVTPKWEIHFSTNRRARVAQWIR